MDKYRIAAKIKNIILALGAESAGNFSVYKNGAIYHSDDFGDLLDENNFEKFQKAVLLFLGKEKIKPDIILTDLHPEYVTTRLGGKLSEKYKAEHIQVQHHISHIFSQWKENIISKSQNPNTKYQIPNTIYGIALDGTGYGLDERIWGGEVFQISNLKFQISNKSQIKNSKLKTKMQVERIGHLENHIMIGSELAVREPARMLIAIIVKHVTCNMKNLKEDDAKKYVYNFIKKYYTKNEFELLYNQLKQNFNCVETSSAGRILDAVAVLLGFSGNERNYKHEAASLLEANSTEPYFDIKPRIDTIKNLLISNLKFQISNEFQMIKFPKKYYILNTTYLFEYLIKNLHKDKRRLAATAQLYLAKGLCEIIYKSSILNQKSKIYLSGGISNNKIISEYFAKANKKTGDSLEAPAIPRGDAGLSFGQIVYYLFGK